MTFGRVAARKKLEFDFLKDRHAATHRPQAAAGPRRDRAAPTPILARLGIAADDLVGFTVAKRSYDARKRGAIVLIYSVDVDTHARSGRPGAAAAAIRRVGGKVDAHARHHLQASSPGRRPAQPLRPVVIGMGPCGLFAGLMLAQMGFRPIILERGKNVRERTEDTFGLWRKRVLNPESNVQFGEGGAGTFSDGKLYSQIKDKRHSAARC